MITLYAHPSQNVLKVEIALIEMGLDYKTVNDRTLETGTADFEAFRKASPTGQVPAILDDETGAHVFESAAILLYLAEKSGQFLPGVDRPQARAEVQKWLVFEAASFTPAMLDIYHYTLQADEDVPYAEERARARARRALNALEDALGQDGGRAYLAGDYSIADMISYPWLPILEDFADIDPMDYTRLAAWTERVAARPAVQKAES